MIDGSATARVERLVRWLEHFKPCFGHRAQVLALRTYVQGVFSDSDRKSMQAMRARVTEPVSYQAFQHFITHAPWDAARVWQRLRAVLPERRGLLILDSTSFPKQGTHSVGVARQYCGVLGKIATCQVATTVALWTGVRAWCLGVTLYLPEPWLTADARAVARIPQTVRFQEKWRHALTLLRQVRAAGFSLTGVIADAEFGDIARLRLALHRLRLPYAMGISASVTAFLQRPRFLAIRPSALGGPPRTGAHLARGHRPRAVREIARRLPRRAWRRLSWRNGTQPARRGRFAAVRVTPAVGWRRRRVPPDVWLLCEQEGGRADRLKYYFIHLPPTASLRALVTLVHQRWAIEQQYQELKGELGLDHFEGRSYPGWQHHVVLTAVAHAYIQRERMRRGASLTFPVVRAIVQEIFTALLFIAKPSYTRWMEQAKHKVQLRI